MSAERLVAHSVASLSTTNIHRDHPLLSTRNSSHIHETLTYPTFSIALHKHPTAPRRPPCFGKVHTLTSTMPSSRQRYSARALFFLTMSLTAYADELSPMTYKGCYSSSTGLSKYDTYLYQTSGWCQPKCVAKNAAVLATSNGDECWCGNELPPSSDKVDDGKCNTPCTGFGSEDCKFRLLRDTHA